MKNGQLLILGLGAVSAFPLSTNSSFASSNLTTTGIFNEYTATRMATYSGAAYCCGTLGRGVEKWDCNACKKLPKLETTVFSDGPTNSNGYVGYDATDNQIIVAFAGTDPLSVKNWLDDLDFLQEKYAPCPGCLVHEGFHRSYTNVQDKVRGAVRIYKSIHPDATVHVTGHSLGAAVADIAALDLVQQGFTVDEVYTFGEPRVGNVKFFQYHKKILGGKYWRVTHGFDPVPHLPLELMNFHHVSNEVYYNEFQTNHIICDGSGEDFRCSNKNVVSLNILDHLTYMKFDFTANFLFCKL